MNLNITQIILDPQLNTRIAGLDLVTVTEYAESMSAGDIFPPLDVFTDGENYWLVDGFHRIEAMKQTGITETTVTLHQGTWREAKLFSFQVNVEHGKRRTNADKRRNVMQMLEDDEWANWSDHEIARRCRVTNHLIAAMREIHRRETLTRNSPSENTERTYITKHGTVSTMQTANIGKSENKAQTEPEFEDEENELDDGYVDLLLDEIEPTNAELDEIVLSVSTPIPKVLVETDKKIELSTPNDFPPKRDGALGHGDIGAPVPQCSIFLKGGLDSLEKMIQQLKTTVYKAVIRIFKQLEHDDLIKGNGYYVAQKVADFTKQELLSRWKQLVICGDKPACEETKNETQP